MLSRAILVRQLTMRDATRSGCRMLASRTHLFAKGKGVHGALGLGEELRSKTSFSKVITVAEQSDIVSVRAGWGHSVWLENDGIVRLMGKPYDFTNLMRFHWIGRVSQELARYYALATQSLGISEGTYVYPIELPTDFPVTACDASAGLTTLLLSDGSIRCFGQNRWMQCGVESKKSMQIYQPVLVPMVPPCTAISSGLQHCIALSQDGVIFAWGKNSKGQLGIGSGADVAMPPSKVVKIENDGHIISCSSMVFTSISAGFSHSAAICQEGFLYVWGGGMSNKLKVDAPKTIEVCEDQLIPRRIELPNNRKAMEVCCSNFSTVVKATDGTIWAIGLGEHDRNATGMLLPVQTDYDHRLSFAEQTSNNLSCKEVAALPVEAQLKKGYHRVSIVLPIYDHQPNTTKRTGCTIFDVVIHMKEAYLLPVVLELDSKDITLLPFNDDNSEFHQGSILSGYEIVDYSEGWQHSLIAIKGLESTS